MSPTNDLFDALCKALHVCVSRLNHTLRLYIVETRRLWNSHDLTDQIASVLMAVFAIVCVIAAVHTILLLFPVLLLAIALLTFYQTKRGHLKS
jgi:4-amino-4-deoxy-L-arabinose transferase-like glycosyltransferase